MGVTHVLLCSEHMILLTPYRNHVTMYKEVHMTTDELMLVQVQLARSLVTIIDHLKIDWDMNRAEVIDKLVREGLKGMIRSEGEDAELIAKYFRL